MINQVIRRNSAVSNTFFKIVNSIKKTFLAIQKSMEASAYSKILSQYGSQLTVEQREQIRKNLVEIMNKK